MEDELKPRAAWHGKGKGQEGGRWLDGKIIDSPGN